MKRRHFLKKFSNVLGWIVFSYGSVAKVRAQTDTIQDDAIDDLITEEGLEQSIITDPNNLSENIHPMHEHIVSAFGEYEQIIAAHKVALFLPSKIEYTNSIAVRVEALERKDINAIAIIIDNNIEPLVIVSELSNNSDAYLSIRAKIESASLVRGIVRTAEGLEEIVAQIEY